MSFTWLLTTVPQPCLRALTVKMPRATRTAIATNFLQHFIDWFLSRVFSVRGSVGLTARVPVAVEKDDLSYSSQQSARHLGVLSPDGIFFARGMPDFERLAPPRRPSICPGSDFWG